MAVFTGNATATSGSPTVTVTGIVLAPISIFPGATVSIGGQAYFLLAIVNTTTLTLTRNYTGANGTFPVEINTISEGETEIVELNRRTADLIEDLLTFDPLANLASISPLTGTGVLYQDATGAHSLVPKGDFTQGVETDGKANTIAQRNSLFGAQAANFTVLVADVGDGRSAVYFKQTNALNDWSAPAYLTGAASTVPGPPGIVPRGAYSASVTYAINDTVTLNGSTFRKLTNSAAGTSPSTAIPPVNNANWEVFAARGANGAGTVSGIAAGAGISVNDTDPTTPVVSSFVVDGDKTDVVVSGTGSSWAVKANFSPQGRLSLATGVAITTADIAGSPWVYYVPFIGDRVPVYDGTNFISRSIGDWRSLPLTDTSMAGWHQSGRNFDAFIINDAGTVRLGTGAAWTDGAVAGSDIARGTGAGSTDLELFQGVWVNRNDIIIRFGTATDATVFVAARRATYVGSFRTTANGQTDDTQKRRLVYNLEQAPRVVFTKEPANSWVYNVATWRQQNANVNNRIEVLAGLAGSLIDIKTTARASGSDATTRAVFAGIGVDKTNDDGSIFNRVGNANNTAWAYPEAVYIGNVALGFHFFAVLEKGATPATVTFLSGADKSIATWGEVWL